MARRSSLPPPPRPPIKMSSGEMQQGIQRLVKRVAELESFIPEGMTESQPPELTALEASITRALERTFGEGTADFKRFERAGKLRWMAPIILNGPPTPLSRYQEGVKSNIETSRALLVEAIRSLEEDLAEAEQQQSTAILPSTAPVADTSRRVFVVHGHDEGPRESIARFLERMSFEPVILHERANKGRTIITKFQEEAADIGFAVVLMTPDDVGGPKEGGQKPRARQNVVFELGYFIGRLGPARVVAMLKGVLEHPSDFDGVVYISLDKEDWKTRLGQELQGAGYEIDWNKLMR